MGDVNKLSECMERGHYPAKIRIWKRMVTIEVPFRTADGRHTVNVCSRCGVVYVDRSG